uniref:Uncharacterized protein n=1 Tax=Parascaris univalens TaxID=6257 RepID=A0A915CJY0_PARUN
DMIFIRELILIIVTISRPLRGSFCGESAIPFSFEALPDGQPVLGCARPTCFGWNADGKPFSQNAQFYSVNKIADGFMRKAFDMPRERNDDDARG